MKQAVSSQIASTIGAIPGDEVLELYGQNSIISVAEALQMGDEDFKTNTVFHCYPSSMNQPTIPLLVRGAHLAQGIPALTPAAGMVGLDNVLASGLSIDINSVNDNGVLRPNGWPTRNNYSGQWRHSDMKEVSYFFNFKFFEKIIEKGILK